MLALQFDRAKWKGPGRDLRELIANPQMTTSRKKVTLVPDARNWILPTTEITLELRLLFGVR